MPSATPKRTLASVLARRACSITLLAVTVPLAAACHPLIPAETDSRARGAETLEAFCGGRCVLVDRVGKPASSCTYEGIAEHTEGFSVLTHGDGKEIVNAAGSIVLSGDYRLLKNHGNGLVEARSAAGGGDVAFYSSAGHRVAHFETRGGSDRVKTESSAGAPVVTRCRRGRCAAFLLGPDGQTVAEFAHLDVLEGHDVAAASLDGRYFGLIDRQLRWVGRRDYDAILAGTPVAARRNGGLTVLETNGRELIPLGNYSGVGSTDTGTLTAKVSDSGDCLYFTPQGAPLPTRNTACLLRGGTSVGYYIFGDDTSSYIGNDQGEALSPRMDGLLLPLNREAVAHVTAGSEGRMGTVSPLGVPQLPPRYSALSAFRARASGTVFRDDLLVASVEGGTGLMDLAGRWRIEPRYVEVGPVSRTLVYVREENGELQLFDTDGKSIGATHFMRPERAALLDGTHGIVATKAAHMGVLDDEGRWRVPARYQHVTITRHGGVIVYLENPSGQDTAQVLNLLTNQPYPGLALDLVHERADGLLEGYSATDVTRYLFTVQGEILARVPVPVPVPQGSAPAPCAFHADDATP